MTTSSLAYLGDGHDLLAATRDLIAAAQHGIVLQMYLFGANGDQTLLLPRPGAFPYAATVADWLIDKRTRCPEVPIVVLLDTNTPDDPARTRRRGELVRHRLARAGVIVLNACLFANRFERRRRWWAPMNLHLSHDGVALEDWVARQSRWQFFHNVEDHRKNLVIDGGRAGAITSHNFFDPAFDWHENLFWLTGGVARALWRTALGAMRLALTIPQRLDTAQREQLDRLLAGEREPIDPPPLAPTLGPVPGFPLERSGSTPALTEDPGAELVENEAIKPRLLAMFAGAANGDEIRVATTYFSDLDVLQALAEAAERGASVRILVDTVHALPLPPVPAWLTRSLVNHEALRAAASHMRRHPRLSVRVHDSRHGRMMHLKTASLAGRVLLGGQANYTPNSFDGSWLETNVQTSAPAVLGAFAAHFDRLWALPESRPLEPPRGLRRHATHVAFAALLAAFRQVGLSP